MRKRYVAPWLACLALAVPASASAHARTATVALDYRLVLDRPTDALDAVRVKILDGDRSLRIAPHGRQVLVLGDLREPMLRIGPSGAWANRASVTAVAERLVSSGSGWKRVGGQPFTWHDHRLAPPPYDAGRLGTVARFSIPVRVDGARGAIAGSFVRYARPQLWPWLLAAIVALATAVFLCRRVPARRPLLTIVLGSLGGLAAVASLASFGVADSPTGRVAWVELGLAVFVAIAATVGLVRLHGERRVVLAGVIGAAAAATTIGSLGVFRHAVVVSSFPAPLARGVCAVAFVAGAAATATGLLTPAVRR